jgi:cytidylate kinase
MDMSIIAISRGSLSAASKLAAGLSEKLDATVITREEVIEIAERYGLHQSGLREKDILEQHPPGFWEDYSDARRHYLVCFKAALLDAIMEGSIIYHGNLAHVLLDDIPSVLRVRINAPVEDRVKVLMNEEGISREYASDKIKEIDQRRKRWTQFLYDAEARSPILFDLVLNIGKMSIADGIDLVAAEAQKPQFQTDEQSMKTIRDIHLAVVAEAYLMHFPGTYALTFDVAADSVSGGVTVGGTVATRDVKSLEADIRSALSDVELIKNIDIRVNVG